jgi:hypothetical protein
VSQEKATDFELLYRYNTLLKDYAKTAPELAALLEKFGRIRHELQEIAVEAKKRNLDTAAVEAQYVAEKKVI